MSRIRSHWETYRAVVLPVNASPETVAVARHAYFAGFSTGFQVVNELFASISDVDQLNEKAEALATEMNELARQVSRGEL